MRRHLLTVLLFLLLGAVANVAVAWGCAKRGLGPTSATRTEPDFTGQSLWQRRAEATWPEPVQLFHQKSFGVTLKQAFSDTLPDGE